MIDIELDYFYGKEAEQFNFYRLPKILFTDIRYSKVSAEEKILYGLLLDRMCLSLKNGWVDNDNRVYIYFTLEDAMEMLNVGKDKGVKLFAELDCAKGCGLIRHKKQGLGKPTIIYVMNFISKSNPEHCIENAESEECDLQTSEKTNSKVLVCTEVQTSEKPQSIVKNRLLKLDYTHIEYVFDCLKKGGNRVKNIKSYMLTMLYNSYATIGHYYTAEVAADSLI